MNTKSTAARSATSSHASNGDASSNNEIETLLARVEEIRTQQKNQVGEIMKAKIAALPAFLGLPSLADVIRLLTGNAQPKQQSTRRPTWKRLSDEEKIQVAAMLQSGKRVAVVANKMKVSRPTIYNIRQKLAAIMASATGGSPPALV